MKFNSVKSGNFSGMAGHVNKVMDQAFQAGRETAVDNTAIAKESIKGRSLERRAAMKAESQVAQAGLKAFSKTKDTKNKIDSAEKIRDIMRPAKRMAGVVAGLGAISQAAVMQKNLKEDRAEREAFKAQQQAITDKSNEMFAQQQSQFNEMLQNLQNGLTNASSTPPKPDGSEPTSSGSGSSANSGSSSSLSTVKPTSTKGFRSDVYNYLTQHHKLSKNKALGLMANIDRESSFRINPQGGDNGNSFGMFQWNNTYGRSQRMKENVSDWQTDWKGQIDYALGGSQLPEYNKVTSDFKNTTFETPQQAADYWMRHWERPAHQERDSARHTQILSGYNF